MLVCQELKNSITEYSTDVATVWRRDLNKRRIQPNSINTDDNSDKQSHQHTYFKKRISSRTRIISEIVFFTLVIAIPLSVQAGVFAKYFSNKEGKVVPDTAALAVEAIDTPLLASMQNPNAQGARGGADIVVDENSLVSTGPVGKDEIAELKNTSGEIRVYTVRPGDSLSEVAEMFGVTTNTIMWANDLNRATEIQPGDSLVILPIVGVRHIVKKGDTISTIAKKYEGETEEILAYNQLLSAEDITVGDTLIIPGGAMHAAPVRVAANAKPVSVSGVASASGGGFVHPAPGSIKTQSIHGYNAVDLAGAYGSSIRAAAAGEVIVSKSSGWNGGYGQYIVIKHNNGTQTLYGHLSSNAVGVGAYVSQGQVIGGMGSTGKSTGTHLHFEVRGGNNPF
ncbi:M23 family metallopeptidase [Candidatus Nomurabacteria bacterium]|nr:M23 family metallopeptidase [Candidatus Kaiserbacteria bacterium]MCB9814530.1 M23 family metallopeptidase [Candidatus Nomurabacteria bacterium]